VAVAARRDASDVARTIAELRARIAALESQR
jgi:hypothetical protein